MGTELTLRPARPNDRPAMERICAHTWDWGDYVPETWDDWLADEQGVVLIGELEGHAVALSKITFQTPDQVWLEGMRVHPEFRNRGIAGEFLDYGMGYARSRVARVVRLATGGQNAVVHSIVARAGMHRVGKYVLWSATASVEVDPPPVLEPKHASEVEALLQGSRVLAHTHQLYSTGWAWQELSASCLSQMLFNGRVVGQWAPDGGLAAVATIHIDPQDRILWIGFADVVHTERPGEPLSPLIDLATAIRGLAAQPAPALTGADKVRIMLTDLPWLRDAFRSAGYGPADWDGELWVYERRLLNRQGDSHEE